MQSPEYQGQIHLQDDNDQTSDSSSINSCAEHEGSDSEPITVVLDTITSSMSSYPKKIYATVEISNKRNIQMKVDAGAHACILTTDDLQRLGFPMQQYTERL